VTGLETISAAEPVAAPALRPNRLPARWRQLLPFPLPPWRKLPEPRVRYGQACLPGLAVLEHQADLDATAVLERATAVRAGRFTHHGRTVSFRERIEWDAVGLSEAWRFALTSLEDLYPLGVAATLVGDAEARRGWYEVAAGLIREWLGGSRSGRRLAWSIPALSRRVPNLVHAATFFAPELRVDLEMRRLLIESLYAQATALAAGLERAVGPWRIAAGRALFLAGRFFDGMDARAWLESGAALLWAQLREQVHEDGGHAGRNPAVHTRVLADYLEVLALLSASNDDVPIWARKRLKGMADFLVRLLHPDQDLPAFHGTALGEVQSVAELLATAAVVLHEPSLAIPGDLPGVWPLLILGDAGRRAYQHLPRQRPAAAESRALRRTGYYLLAGPPGDVMILDGGTPPADGSPNVFGYELSVGGERLIVGPGAWGEASAVWKDYARRTRAHNVAMLEATEQSVRLASGELRGPEVKDVRWVVRDGLVYFRGAHDGFTHLLPELRYRRHVFGLPGRFWVVCDEVLGHGSLTAESYVHCHPDAILDMACRERPVVRVARSAASALQIITAGSPELRVMCGVDDPELQGWYAAVPGKPRPAPMVVLATAGPLPLAFGYALLPRFDGSATLTLRQDAFQLEATLRLDEQIYVLTVVQDEVELRISE
jgi:uncharacterized heparinase superfamily protein